MNRSSIQLLLKRFVFIAWAGITLAAFAAMFHLWSVREARLYMGKSDRAQREALFEHIGMPVTLLSAAYAVNDLWPEDVKYSARGDHNLLSYLEYILIPRLPVASGAERFLVMGASAPERGMVVVNPESMTEFQIAISDTENVPKQKSPLKNGPIGLALALLSFAGITLLFIKLKCGRSELSWPGCSALAAIFCGLAVLVSRQLAYSLTAGVLFSAVLAVVGWLTYAWTLYKRHPDAPFSWGNCRRVLSGRLYSRRANVWYVLLIMVVFLSILWSFMMAVVVIPDEWDCWAIWGAKAKMLALGAGGLADSVQFGQRDYPLLWPAVWAYGGALSGGWEDQWCKGLGPFFMLLTLCEMVLIIRRELGSWGSGLLGAALFASIPAASLVSSWGYAEPLLWLVSICSLGCFLRWRRSGRLAELILCSVFASAAALTKNEGIVFVALMGLCVLVAGRKRSIINAIVFGMIAAVVISPWLYILFVEAGAGYDSSPPLFLSFHDLTTKLGHIGAGMRTVFNVWVDIRQWTVVLLGLAVWFIATVIRGSWQSRRDLLLPFLMMGIAFTTIILRNENFEWQIGAAWSRLTLQALPSMIVLLFIHSPLSSFECLDVKLRTKDRLDTESTEER